MINVIIVDDHTLFRMGLKSILTACYPDICVTGDAPDGETFFRILPTTTVDLVLLDVDLPDMNGIEISRRLKKEYPQIKILIISMENDMETIQELLENGIDGFISKQQATEKELPEAIKTIMEGMEYYGKDIANIMYDIYVTTKKTTKETKEKKQPNEFSERELEIIELCRQGLLGKEIAAKLNLSLRTVDTHKRNIFKKLGINNTMEMVQYALKHGIITL